MNGGKGMDRRRAGRLGLWGRRWRSRLRDPRARLGAPRAARPTGRIPRPTTRSRPPAGGKVPKARSLASAVTGQGPGQVRVVCKGEVGSLALLQRSVKPRHHERLPPASEPAPSASFRPTRRSDLLEHQPRPRQPLRLSLDPGGDQRLRQQRPRRGHARPLQGAQVAQGAGQRPASATRRCSRRTRAARMTPSYEYQAKCPNDQNLIYVQGRKVKGDPLAQPDPDRHGIPEQELGECIRCNLQIEGSGVRPEDVLLDAGRGYVNGASPGARPGGDDARRGLPRGAGRAREPVLRQARGDAHRPLRRLRRAQLPDAGREGARLLHRGDGRRSCSTR